MQSKRGRPNGWRKRPNEKPWINRGILLPEDVHRWVIRNKETLINIVRGNNSSQSEWLD
jgi:hypothetical protein